MMESSIISNGVSSERGYMLVQVEDGSASGFELACWRLLATTTTLGELLASLIRLLPGLQRRDIAELVGADAGLRPVMRLVDQVAGTTAPVLLLGETGSGKEVVSRAIHARSPRARGPVIRVNCGAIPPELVDAELF